MSAKRLSLAALCGLLAIAAPLGVLASGGGGGGGGGGGSMPSMTTPQYDPAMEYQSGMAAYQAGKFKDAARYFGHVTEAASGEAHGWHMLGMAKVGAGDVKGGSKAFERALRIDPNAIDSTREFALTLVTLKQNDKANAELAKLKARAATCADTCADAAALKAAVAAVDQALAPGAPPTVPAASLTTPTDLIFVQDGDAAYVRAVSLINERRYSEALIALDKAEAAFGAHPDVLTYEGYVWRKLGRLDQAESHYRAALAIAPTHRGATEYYGELKVIEGDLPGAKVMLAHLDAQCAFGCVEAEELRRWIDHNGDPGS